MCEQNPSVTRVAQISDLHLTAAASEDASLRDALRRVLDQAGADCLIFSGDLSDDGHRKPGLFQQVKALIDSLGRPWHGIPGNHDVGNKAGLGQDEVSPEHLATWRACFGDPHFTADVPGWRIVGINSQVIGSGLPDEADQWAWLDQELDGAAADGRAVAMFSHMPPYIREPDEADTGHDDYWAIDPAARPMLLQRLARPEVRLFAHGHLHWHHQNQIGQVTRVWCPAATGSIVDDARFPRDGARTGIMVHTFAADAVTSELFPINCGQSTEYVWFQRLKLTVGGTPKVFSELVIEAGRLDFDAELRDMQAAIESLSRCIRITVSLQPSQVAQAAAWRRLPVELRYPASEPDAWGDLNPDEVIVLTPGLAPGLPADAEASRLVKQAGLRLMVPPHAAGGPNGDTSRAFPTIRAALDHLLAGERITGATA